MTDWEIRSAVAADAEGLSRLGEEIFVATFGPDNTPADMDLYCAEAFAPEAFAGAIADPLTEILIASHGGEMIAYAQLHRGEAPPSVAGARPIELMRFYVLAAWHGAGIARELLRSVARRSSELGAATLWLGVWERNPRAIRFYGKYGIEEVGEQPFLLGTDLQRDLVMAAPIATILERLEASTPHIT
jgi:GNAT superfamily N-acetyltransferase